MGFYGSNDPTNSVKAPKKGRVLRIVLPKFCVPYESSMHLIFRYDDCLVGNDPFYLKVWATLTHAPPTKTPISYRYSLVALQQ